MKPTTNKKDTPVKESTGTVTKPLALRRKGLLTYVPAPTAVADGLRDQEANAGFDDDTTEANPVFQKADMEDAVNCNTLLDRYASSLSSEAVLACMPGAFQVPGPSSGIRTTDPDFVDTLRVTVEDEEEQASVNAGTASDMECEDQQQHILSAYRVAKAEPAILATAVKDNKFRILSYGVLVTAIVIALIVGLSVGLMDKNKAAQPIIPVDRLVSSVRMTAHQEGAFMKANRYIRTENGKDIVITNGSAVDNWCEVVPCAEGGCELLYGKVYEPGCCLEDDCSPEDKCGGWCPRRPDLCRPSSDGCADASCFECERGPNGEELYRKRDALFNMNCLRTGVATGYNDQDDNVRRIYKWAIICGFNVHGGNEQQNFAPDEYVCHAARIGNGVTKTVSQLVPCQIIQLLECGCAPDDIHTFGFPPPDKPCKTRQDCLYLCGDAGEEEAKTLCEVFPGIEWWEGENPLRQPLFFDPKERYFGNVTIQIDIHGK